MGVGEPHAALEADATFLSQGEPRGTGQVWLADCGCRQDRLGIQFCQNLRLKLFPEIIALTRSPPRRNAGVRAPAVHPGQGETQGLGQDFRGAADRISLTGLPAVLGSHAITVAFVV